VVESHAVSTRSQMRCDPTAPLLLLLLLLLLVCVSHALSGTVECVDGTDPLAQRERRTSKKTIFFPFSR
jgi:hypothetical protein